jgi:hypothetical protein
MRTKLRNPLKMKHKFWQNSVLSMITASIIGFLAALLIFFFEDFIGGNAMLPCPGCHVASVRGVFNAYPDFLTWVLLFVIHTSAAVALGTVAFQCVRFKTLKEFSVPRSEITLSFILVMVMMIVSSTSYIFPFNLGGYYKWPISPLNHQWFKIVLLLAISISAASIAVLGIILTGCAIRQTLATTIDASTVPVYFQLKEDLEKYLLITGYILSSGIVTVYFFMATQRSMGNGPLLDKHGVALFGLLFTIFIAITFIPTRLLLLELGRKICAGRMGPAPSDVEQVEKWVTANAAFEKYMQQKLDIIETLRYAIPILGPLLSTLIPSFFGHK